MSVAQVAGTRTLTVATLLLERDWKGEITDIQQPPVDRRTGRDRRADASRAATPTLATAGSALLGSRWSSPFRPGPELARTAPLDPYSTVVRRSIEDYAAGRLHDLDRSWDDAVTWRVVGTWPGDPISGLQPVLAYHQRLAALTNGSFRQEVLSIAASGGPVVEAHVRTTAQRGDRRLDLPSLLVLELVALRVRQVTEIPGDRQAWDHFWAD